MIGSHSYYEQWTVEGNFYVQSAKKKNGLRWEWSVGHFWVMVEQSFPNKGDYSVAV